MRVAIANLKGGAGKTVTAVHLAAGLGRSARTLLVDADPQGSALSWSEEADELPCSVVSLPVRDLHRRIGPLMNGFTHLVVDTPPGDRAIVRSAIAAVDRVIIPIPTSIMDLDRLTPTLELISEIEITNPVEVCVLLTRVRPSTKSGRLTRGVLEEMGVGVLTTEIPLRESFNSSFGTVPGAATLYADVLNELMTRERAA